MKAAVKGCLGVAKLLIQYKAQLDLKNNNGETAIYVAAFNGQIGII